LNVAILGCGPAGLIAAHACDESDVTIAIFSIKEKSVLPGSMYLHEGIPGISKEYPDNFVQYVRLGTAEGYAKKVYGDAGRYTAWDQYLQAYPSWNVQRVYDELWLKYEGSVYPTEFTGDLHNLHLLVEEFDVVITTLPQPIICLHKHDFRGVPYFIRTIEAPPLDREKDLVIYNGYDHDPWYRWSILSGICSIEYSTEPDDFNPVDRSWKTGAKAVENNCGCWPRIHRLGRWAEWRHGVLLHDVYKGAKEVMRVHG